ncbi:hypothetical protein [Halogeometricum salsisoli]|nr:hypothetical protein [Halogeometricum sp. S1BR25-6]
MTRFIEYVAVNDEKFSWDRVVLAHKEVGASDISYYETQIVSC